MTLFFTSDIHFGHENIIKYCKRPFVNADEMNEAIIKNWNETVDNSDTVIIVGDVFMGSPSKWKDILDRLNGKLILVAGNHDPNKCQNLFRVKGFPVYDNLYVDIKTESRFMVDISGIRDFAYAPTQHDITTLWINHFPVLSTYTEHDKGRPKADRPYDLAICGHVHDKWLNNGLCINVGMDQWNYKPIPLALVLSFIE